MKYTLESSREWYNGLPAKRASAAMILNWNGKYLMTKDDYKLAMTFPSGVIDQDESALTAAIRETHEEVGIKLDPANVSFHSVAYMKKQFGFNDRFHFFFYAAIDDAQATQLKLEDGIEYHKWVTADEIGSLAGDRPAYVRLEEMLRSGTAEAYFEA